ncbi:conjugal transfer pilus assembly protein TraF [Pseudoduganella lurida]|uniref:Conjugal transfer pilus assembly protein TraF n=1 Tax=Pseudoduganella lurida TaxID=1036180 RepID=A0A562RLI7_9BURK|nr:conjugal transfer protein TraF [Pseudoduganella lurida]TWI69300.1 conjugal transfer pilus assembly protein TraF [Pseudoduganella lurida]
MPTKPSSPFLVFWITLGLLPGWAGAQDSPGYWSQSTWQDPERGFLWYAPPKAAASPAPAPKPLAAMTNRELGAEIERMLSVAVETQSVDAVRDYLQVQQFAMDRASRFSDVFRRTVWSHPDLDYSLRGRPTNAMALTAYDAERTQRRQTASAQLAASHGLFFFFRSDCPYCHQLAPILKLYERTYGVEVFAVSLDGGTLPDFPHARADNGMATRLAIGAVPAIYLADKRSGQLQPLGFGVLSLEEIVNRVHVLTQTVPGQEY